MAPVRAAPLVATWNVSIPDTSPMLHYTPCDDSTACNLAWGWNTTYTNGTTPQPFTGVLWGSGSSQHETKQSGGAVSFSFTGTSVWLFGQASSKAYNVIVDNRPTSFASGPGLLAHIDGLTPDISHSITLQTSADGDGSLLFFEKAVFTASTGVQSAQVTVANVQSGDSSLSYNGFAVVSAGDFDDGGTMLESHLTNDTVTYHFAGHGVAVYGNLNSDHGFYQVALNGVSRRLNGQSKYALADGMLFYADGLDPTSAHTLAITNLEDKKLDLSYIQVVNANGVTPPPTARSSSPIAVVAVSIVLALIGFASLAAIYLCFRRNRIKQPQRCKEMDLCEDDETDSVKRAIAPAQRPQPLTPPLRPRPPTPPATILAAADRMALRPSAAEAGADASGPGLHAAMYASEKVERLLAGKAGADARLDEIAARYSPGTWAGAIAVVVPSLGTPGTDAAAPPAYEPRHKPMKS